MSEQALYLVLDQGSTSSRAVLFDGLGHRVAFAQQSVATRSPEKGYFEQDPEEIVDSLRYVIQSLLSSLNNKQRDGICSAALVTQRSSIVCWHKRSGEALSPVISWRDVRSAKWLAKQNFSVPEIHSVTGLYPSAHYSASKIHWCLNNLERVKSCAADALCVAPLSSYLLFKLLEEHPIKLDYGNAGRTLLVDIHNGQWSDVMLDRFQIRTQLLPELVTQSHDYGNLLLSDKAVPMLLANGDQASALYARGLPQENAAYVNLGTGGFVYRPVNMTGNVSPSLLKSISFSDVSGRNYIVEGTVNGAGAAIDWARDNLNVDVFDGVLDQVDSSESIPVFINAIGGVGSPYWLPKQMSEFIGSGSANQKLRAVVESIVFMLQRNIEEFTKSGADTERIFCSGGLSHNASICQWLADLTGFSVVRADDSEATAKGAAYFLAGCPEKWAIGNEESFEPQQNPHLVSRYQRWCDSMDNLESIG